MSWSKNNRDIFYNKICVEMYDEIMKFVKYYLHDNRMIEDVVQETFIEAYKHIEELMKHPNYKGWLYNTAKYKAKYMRSIQYKRDSLQTDIESVDTAENAIYDNYENLFFHELKSKLTLKEYELIELKYKYGYTYEEISNYKGISVGACKMRMNRVIKKLRNEN